MNDSHSHHVYSYFQSQHANLSLQVPSESWFWKAGDILPEPAAPAWKQRIKCCQHIWLFPFTIFPWIPHKQWMLLYKSFLVQQIQLLWRCNRRDISRYMFRFCCTITIVIKPNHKKACLCWQKCIYTVMYHFTMRIRSKICFIRQWDHCVNLRMGWHKPQWK